MHRLKPMKPTSIRHQHGITLLESLVAIVVVALGILGILGVQMRTLTDTQTSVRRAQAIRLIEDLSERMKINPNALIDISAYVSAFSAQPSPGNCKTITCNHTELAAYDLGTWKQTVKSSLPLGQASIFLAKGETVDANRRQLGVMISWRENERVAKVSDADDADSTTYRGAINASAGGGDVTCPADRTCHLQYLPVPARCAPYDNGSGTLAFYC
jgi:type IV pilus assembly protein PilV